MISLVEARCVGGLPDRLAHRRCRDVEHPQGLADLDDGVDALRVLTTALQLYANTTGRYFLIDPDGWAFGTDEDDGGRPTAAPHGNVLDDADATAGVTVGPSAARWHREPAAAQPQPPRTGPPGTARQERSSDRSPRGGFASQRQ